ncbi:MAG: hypothetical protein ACFFA0_08080 [Promethearchaeota archaeon]
MSIKNTEEKYKKATESLQKIWWFCFYLLISPLTIGFVGYWIYYLFRGGFLIALSLSVITYMFALLFFYKAYDKYRNNPFFLNKENNLIARIQIVFLISILSFVVAPIFSLISRGEISFALLPLISFATLYNIVYYYFHFQPIDFYSKMEGVFKHAIDSKLMLKQPYNFIIFMNYIGTIIFLFFTFPTDLSWLFALINNFLLYIITFSSTKKLSGKINEAIKENKPFLYELMKFKQRFVIAIISLIFIQLIQIPLINIIIFSFSGVHYTNLELLSSSFLSIIFLFLYLKSLFYTNFYYNNRFNVYANSIKTNSSKGNVHTQSIKYQIYNAFISGLLVVLITTFTFLINNSILVIIILPIFFIFFYSEQKAGICPKKYNRYIFLLNSLAILITFSFGLLDLILLNYQFLIAFIGLYFILQIFVKYDYFSKDNIVIIQNILATASFTIIAYSFFKFTTFENLFVFEYTLFISDPRLIFILNFVLHGLLISIISIFTFYTLYSRYFYKKHSRLFRSCLLTNFFLIELFIFLWINFRTFFLIEILMLSSLLFPSMLLLFSLLNYLLGVFSYKSFVKLSYYLLWVLIGNIFLSLFLVYLGNYTVLTIDFLFLSIFSQLNLRFGLKLDKVKESTVHQFIRANSYFMTIEFIMLFFFFFYSIVLKQFVLYDRIILSVYFSFISMTILANILSRSEKIFSQSITNKINIGVLFTSAGLVFYYLFLFTSGSYYIFLYPFLSLFITLYFPFFYLLRKKIYEKFIQKVLLINSTILAILISSIPIILSLEFSRLGRPVDILVVVNYTLLIFPSTFLIFDFTNYILGLITQKQFLILNYYLLWILILDIFIIIFSTFITNFILLTLSFFYLSIFSQLNLKFGRKLEKVKDSTVKNFVNINSYIITGEIFTLSFFLFNTIISVDMILSIYFSLLIITFYVNLLSWNEVFFSESLAVKINIITLTFSAGIAYYYSFLLTNNTYYVLLIPSLCLFSILFFPLYYMLRKKIIVKHTHRLLVLDCIFIAIFLTLIPTIVSLELIRLGDPIEIMSTLNYTLYIAFGILTFAYYISKEYTLKEIYSSRILKSQVFIEIIIAGTTVYYYTFLLLFNTYYRFLFPFIGASVFFYLPSIFTYRKHYFKESIVKKSLLLNSLFLSGLITLIPTVVGLELIRLGLEIDIFVIIASSLILLFGVLNFLYLIGNWYIIQEKWGKFLKFIQMCTWFSISLFVAFVIFSYLIIDISISISIFVFFILSIFTLKLLISYSKDLKVINFLEEFLLYGLIFSFSYLITSLFQFSELLAILPSGLKVFSGIWYLGLFFLVSLPLNRFFSSQVRIKYTLVNNSIGFVSWLILKLIVCVFISILFSYSILTSIISFSLTFTFFTPITVSYFKELKIFSEQNLLNIKRFMLIIFIISSLVLYVNFFYQFTTNVSIFNKHIGLHISFILANLYLYLYYFLMRYNRVLQEESSIHIIWIYSSSFMLFLSLLYIFWILLIIPIFIALILLLYQRSINIFFRFISYFLLSYIIFVDLLSIFSDMGILSSFNLTLFGLLASTYLLTLMTVLLFSVWFNYNKNNSIEKFVVYILLSLISFTLLNVYTNILLLYNITISLFIFLFFTGIYFYHQKSEFYRWFINPCVILLVFDIISFISYSILFNNPIYMSFNPILTFTLTMSVTGFTFILLYNKAPARFRKVSFYFILFSIILSFPIFLYFLIISSFPALIGDPVPIIITINVGVFLYYMSVGFYQWRVSWAIWKSGWYAWIIIPIINFLIIYQSIRGIDVITNSLTLFGTFDMNGSVMISLMICVILSLPVWYTWFKKHFYHSLFIVWGVSLFLLYWISKNIFVGEQLLTNLSFFLLAIFLLVPLFIKLKFWKITSFLWITLISFNSWFLLVFLTSIMPSFEVAFSIDILAIGILFLVYSFFPNIRSIGIILVSAYYIVLTGIFLSIFFILYIIILDPIFSLNLSFIVLGFSLFSSKYIKFPVRIINLSLSWILIINFSWLTFNTFNLLPKMNISAFFLALTVFGCSFFIFNRYKMKFRINKIFPFLAIAIGASASTSFLLSNLFNFSPYIQISIFSGIFIICLYFLIIEYRYFLWALIPIPLTLPILELLLIYEVIRNVWLLAFSAFSTMYIIFFWTIINLFRLFIKDESEEIKNSLMKIYQEKNQIKVLNFVSFLLNSIFFSIFISVIFPFLTRQFIFNEIIYVYQILDFLIIWPIFILLSLKYIEKSEIDLKIRDPLRYFNKICFLIYFLIPVALALNMLLFMIFTEMNSVINVYTFLLIVSGIIFLESYILDRRFFYYLFNSTRNAFIFWSWFAFSNILSFFFFMFYSNIFLLLVLLSLLNQISLSFLSHLDIPEQIISNGRIILYYTLFVSGSFYFGFLITEGIVNLFDDLRGYTFYTIFFQNSILLLYICSIFIKIDTKLKSSIEVILFIIFQGLLSFNWLVLFNLLNMLNFFSSMLIILIETCFSFKTVKSFNELLFAGKKPQFLFKTYSLLIILLYFETSLLIYGLMIEFVSVYESILISQLLFFAFTLLDIYSLKKIRKSYAYLINTISYFIISLMVLIILNNYVVQYQILLSIEFLIFILMQFYTIHSFCTSLNHFYPNKIESIKRRSSNINHVLGISFYIDLCFLLLHVLILSNVELQLILLSLSLMVHVLMLIDISLMKFLGKSAKYFKVISWMFIMTFTTTYIFWLYIAYYIDFLFTSIPLIIFILIIETTYLFKLLDFWKLIISNKKKIQSSLLLISYLDFISWPIYFARIEPISLLNLIILSLLIMIFLTYIDKYLGVLKKNLLIAVRKTAFLTLGLLLSVDIFILLSNIPNTTLVLNLSISLLNFIIFFGIIIKPFKFSHWVGFIFWLAIFSLLSTTLSELFQIWQIIPVLIILTPISYAFIFALEELRELFNNFVDMLTKFLRKIELLLINAFKTLYKFLKTHFRIIWILFSASVAVFLGVLLSERFFSILLGPIHPTLLAIAIFAFLILVIPSSKSSDPDIIFKRRIVRLSYGWGSVVAFLFIYITPDWYFFTIFISIAVVGSIILIFIGRKEEREKISIKLRFYILLILFVLLIIFGALFVIQLIRINI